MSDTHTDYIHGYQVTITKSPRGMLCAQWSGRGGGRRVYALTLEALKDAVRKRMKIWGDIK